MACQLLEIEIELEKEYKQFIKTEEGIQWIESWISKVHNKKKPDFGDFLYDFYPEYLG